MSLKHASLGLAVLLALGTAQGEPQPGNLHFVVRHRHRLGSCQGPLRIETNGITYETPHVKHARTWTFRDIRHATFVSKTRLALRTHGTPEMWEFRLREGEWSAATYRLFAERVERGATSRILFPAAPVLYELPARHLHWRGSCEGTLRIGAKEIVYDTADAEDRRIWRARDLRSFGSASPYDLRLTTEEETFNFDLKQALPREVYDHFWRTIYEKERNR